MKKYFLTAIALISLTLTSCDSDDGFPTNDPTGVTNQFFFGPEPANFFNVSRAFNNNPVETALNVFTTNVVIVDANFTTSMGALSGTGRVINLTFTGDQNFAIQGGTYDIGTNANTVGNVSASYSLDFNTADQLNSSTLIVSGQVRVSANNGNFIIQVLTVDANGDLFEGNYVGALTPFN